MNTQTIQKTGTQTTLGSFALGYDPAGNVTSKTSTVGSNAANGTWAYTYDAMRRMTQATGPNATGVQTSTLYGYDGASDRITTKVGAAAIVTTSYDAAGYPTSGTDATTYTLDKIGDLLKVDRSGTSLDESYGYDAYARLVCAKMATTATCSNTTSPVTWSLDALDRASTRTSSVATTTYAYRGLSPDPVKTVAGSTTTTYAMGLANPLAQKSGSTTRFYLSDLHDDVVGMADTTGASQGTRSFDPWGTVLASSGSASAFGFQADLTDPTTAQVDMGTRWYSPGLGRFSSRDSVYGDATNPATLNQFAYGNDAPVTFSDPTGMSGCEEAGDPKCTGKTTNDWRHAHHLPPLRHITPGGHVLSYSPPPPPIPPPIGAPVGAFASYKNRVEDYRSQVRSSFVCTQCQSYKAAHEESHHTGGGCGLLWHSCWRLPDYVSVDTTLGLSLGPIPIVLGGNLTVTRAGHIYYGPEGGLGAKGVSGSVRGGWVDQSTPSSDEQTDQFVNKWSGTASGYVPAFGTHGPTGGVTWGNQGSRHLRDFSTEVGWGAGQGGYFSVTETYNFRLPLDLPGW